MIWFNSAHISLKAHVKVVEHHLLNYWRIPTFCLSNTCNVLSGFPINATCIHALEACKEVYLYLAGSSLLLFGVFGTLRHSLYSLIAGKCSQVLSDSQLSPHVSENISRAIFTFRPRLLVEAMLPS